MFSLLSVRLHYVFFYYYQLDTMVLEQKHSLSVWDKAKGAEAEQRKFLAVSSLLLQTIM